MKMDFPNFFNVNLGEKISKFMLANIRHNNKVLSLILKFIEIIIIIKFNTYGSVSGQPVFKRRLSSVTDGYIFVCFYNSVNGDIPTT